MDFIILLIAAVLKNLMKYASVNAFLSGVRPCVIAMILAMAISMTVSTLLGFTDTHNDTLFCHTRHVALGSIKHSLCQFAVRNRAALLSLRKYSAHYSRLTDAAIVE